MKDLLRLLNPEELSLGKEVAVKKGQMLFHEGEECRAVAFLVSGRVSIVSYSYHGKELLYRSIGPGESFGHNLLFAEDKRYRGDVKAEAHTTLLLFPKKALLSLLQRNEAFLAAYLSRQSESGKTLNERVKMLSFPTLEERLFYALYLGGGKLPCPSVASLSRSLGSERETLSRLLSKLEKEKKIARAGKAILAL